MTVKLDDLTHPKNHYCDQCKMPAGKWCVTTSGKVRASFAKQHANRIYKADQVRGGPMIGGVAMLVVYMADGSYVPKVCVDALDELNMTWPGATFSPARPAVVRAVLEAYGKLTKR